MNSPLKSLVFWIVVTALGLGVWHYATTKQQDLTAVQAQAQTSATTPEFINMTDPWPYPFSSAVKAGNFIFLPGRLDRSSRTARPCS